MDLYKILDEAGLSEEDCKKSKKLKQMRIILIDKYEKDMDREEICADIFSYGMDYISLSTYHRRLNKALNKIKKYID